VDDGTVTALSFLCLQERGASGPHGLSDIDGRAFRLDLKGDGRVWGDCLNVSRDRRTEPFDSWLRDNYSRGRSSGVDGKGRCSAVVRCSDEWHEQCPGEERPQEHHGVSRQ
jgi:hypothetical protein